MRRALLAVAVAGLVACGSSTSGPPWKDYAPGVQQQIDALVAAKDCTGLQAQFDAADANSATVMAKTGHNNAELMRYIDDGERRAGCHA